MTGTTAVLVRHAETDWNRADRLQGWAPVALNDRGRDQARHLGDSLARTYTFDRVVASDLLRTRETTALLAEAGIAPEPTFTSDWREQHVGIYQGMTREQLNEQFPAFALDSGHLCLHEHPDGGERLRDICERVLAAWERLCERAAGETVLVVTHGGPVTVLLATVEGQDVLTALAEYSVPNCAVTELHVGDNPGSAVTRRLAERPAVLEDSG